MYSQCGFPKRFTEFHVLAYKKNSLWVNLSQVKVRYNYFGYNHGKLFCLRKKVSFILSKKTGMAKCSCPTHVLLHDFMYMSKE